MSDTNAYVQLCEKVIIVVMLLHDRSDLLIGWIIRHSCILCLIQYNKIQKNCNAHSVCQLA